MCDAITLLKSKCWKTNPSPNPDSACVVNSELKPTAESNVSVTELSTKSERNGQTKLSRSYCVRNLKRDLSGLWTDRWFGWEVGEVRVGDVAWRSGEDRPVRGPGRLDPGANPGRRSSHGRRHHLPRLPLRGKRGVVSVQRLFSSLKVILKFRCVAQTWNCPARHFILNEWRKLGDFLFVWICIFSHLISKWENVSPKMLKLSAQIKHTESTRKGEK